MKCLFINNDGAGFADQIEMEPGSSIAQLFAKHFPGRNAGDYLIRVNRLPAAADQVLAEGDRVSITPTKITGAWAVFCCVDSISTRRLVWEGVKREARLFADGRMSAEVIRVLASSSPATDVYYASTLFDEAQAYAGGCASFLPGGQIQKGRAAALHRLLHPRIEQDPVQLTPRPLRRQVVRWFGRASFVFFDDVVPP